MNITQTNPTLNLVPSLPDDPWPDPAHRHDAHPLDDLPSGRLEELIPVLLTHWDSPTMTELGLCRQHRITLAQLRAIAELPRFREALEDLRALREARRPAVEARARATALDRLLYVASFPPSSASFAREIRGAVKLALTLLGDAAGTAPEPRPAPEPEPTTPARAENGGGPEAEPRTPTPARVNSGPEPTMPIALPPAPDRRGPHAGPPVTPPRTARTGSLPERCCPGS